MVTVLLITNIVLLGVIITMAFFYCRKPKPTAEQKAEKRQEEYEKEQQRKAINSVMNYNVDTARRANG